MLKIDITKNDDTTRALKGAVDMMNTALDIESMDLFRTALYNYVTAFDVHTQEEIAEYIHTEAEELEIVLTDEELFDQIEEGALSDLLMYLGLYIRPESRKDPVKYYLED